MTIQDWGITYAELEPYYDKFEYMAGVSGKAGNIRGQIQPGGNPFEAPRAREYPLPPLSTVLASQMFSEAAKNQGYHPFPRPSANASRAYTNPDGARFGACQYCGFCQRFGCEANATIDDFNLNWDFDRGELGFVGGYTIGSGFNSALPIGYRPVPSGTPSWGKAWKTATAKWYQTAMNIGSSGSVMANRYNYYDLDPTYRNAFGLPLMRMTFDYKENEYKMGRHAAQLVNDIAKSMNPTTFNPATARTEPWTVVPYQSTHNTGGTIMGTNPKNSAVNKYLQSWDCHNLFLIGANVFVHNAANNPTGPVGALAYWTADAIRNRYMKNPGPLVSA